MFITAAVEGRLDAAVVVRVCGEAGWDVVRTHGFRGKSHIDGNLPGYNHAAAHSPWIVLRDLDTDAPCAAELVERLLPDKADGMLFRVPVRQIESWVLADTERIAEFLGVQVRAVPSAPDELQSPKATLVQLARRSRRASIRSGIPPTTNTGAVGPDYNGLLVEFTLDLWRPQVAAQRSDSLRRCLARLRELRVSRA